MKLEEALGLVEEVRNCSLPWDDEHWEALGIVIDYVKNKSQTTWRPSDEQIEALEHFVRSIGESGYASPYDNNTKLLYSLFNDLKKLRDGKV